MAVVSKPAIEVQIGDLVDTGRHKVLTVKDLRHPTDGYLAGKVVLQFALGLFIPYAADTMLDIHYTDSQE